MFRGPKSTKNGKKTEGKHYWFVSLHKKDHFSLLGGTFAHFKNIDKLRSKSPS